MADLKLTDVAKTYGGTVEVLKRHRSGYRDRAS